MKITKYGHSCLALEEAGRQLVIDPGIIAELPNIKNVVGVVTTHLHLDHLDMATVRKLADHNPEAHLIGPVDTLPELSEISLHFNEVKDGDTLKLEPFTIEVFGTDHAIVHEQVPCHNAAVFINDTLYHPGDSFTIPPKAVKILAVPASAPWMKTGEAIDFIKRLKPQFVFPIHDGLLSDFGKEVTYNWLKGAAESVGAQWRVLRTGETF